MTDPEIEFVDEDDAALDSKNVDHFSDAVLFSTDWTVETILGQMERNNIDLNPRFQRRDAWSTQRKSRFIESIILGLPVPQLVLAERKGHKGSFIVLDGKQRLLTLLQFTGNSKSDNNSFRLSGLDARTDLQRKRYIDFTDSTELRSDLNMFLNHTIRTVVIRNWPSTEFLHLVFLRLNTGSVTLSPQELRQAMVPGPFSDFVDDEARESTQLRILLGRTNADPRMRDVELLVRFLAFRRFLSEYNGRMKTFLDDACRKLNDEWDVVRSQIEIDMEQFALGVDLLIEIFGAKEIARKNDSTSFNRAIFDALIYFAADEKIRKAMAKNRGKIRTAYDNILDEISFAEAIESDTAGIPHTVDRLSIWGSAISEACKVTVKRPRVARDKKTGKNRIVV